jgi:DNA invertase Pin-like site-specific DNA recombinase
MQATVSLRVSTDEQSLGLKAQEDACRAFAAARGWEVAGVFADEGVGGATGLDRRPGLLEALAKLGPGGVLLVAKRDRLGRDPLVIAMIEAAVARKKGRIVSAAGEGTGDDEPGSILMRRMVDAFAEYERLIIKSRTRAALGAKARRGERCGSLRYGFTLSDRVLSKKTASPNLLVPDPAEQRVLGEIRRLRAAGHSLREIARALDARGVPTKKRAAAWSAAAVANALKREAGGPS